MTQPVSSEPSAAEACLRPGSRIRAIRAAVGRAMRVALPLALCGAMGGCETDSFMDPSVIGRWENTPTIVPVLERIDVIERDTGEFVDVTPVMPGDLLPEVSEYRVAPGDVLVVIILDFLEAGRESRFELAVDPRGYVAIPQLGELFINKLSRVEIERLIAQAVIDKGILDDPLVDVQIPGSRQATFSIFGIVDRAGRYVVPGPDYRLLEAITDAGGLPPTVEKLFIIRQVTLTDDGKPVNVVPPKPLPGTSPDDSNQQPQRKPAEGTRLEDLIEELTAPTASEDSDAPVTQPPQGEPAAPKMPEGLEDLVEPPADPPSFGVVSGGDQGRDRRPNRAQRSSAIARPHTETPLHGVLAQNEEPPVDLPDDSPVLPRPEMPIAGAPLNGGTTPELRPTTGKWMFINGEWVNVISQRSTGDGALPDGEDPLKSAPKTQEVVTQRVIEVPVAPLVQGVAQYNLVVRAGDVISVPGPNQGFVYIGGPGSSRPGVYQLPFTGKLTLQRLIMASGGLSTIAIPERVDLTRMVGDDRQATIRLNLRAIAEGTHPDLFLKPDDMINVGTNFWALPLAVIRGGLRASYGFGFLLDRNFGNDVFGAPPDDNPFN